MSDPIASGPDAKLASSDRSAFHGGLMADLVAHEVDESVDQFLGLDAPKNPVRIVRILVVEPGGLSEPLRDLVDLGDQERSGTGNLRTDPSPILGIECANLLNVVVDQSCFDPPCSSCRAVAVRWDANAAARISRQLLWNHEVHGNTVGSQPGTGLLVGQEASREHCLFNQRVIVKGAGVEGEITVLRGRRKSDIQVVTALTEIPRFCSSKFPTLGRSAA